ncbi:MAG: T9SS type A sorting domain-containing protein [Paludibacteraceae bacterium]|nr:T9SS type A sorting domain-containing protein [Paludibacteraceae bacterium]
MKKVFFFKRAFSSLTLLALALAANAEVLIVEQNKENSQKTEKTSYDLGDKPVLTYSGDNLVVKTNNASAEFPLGTVVRYYFSETDPTGVAAAQGEMGYLFVTEEGIRMSGFEPSLPVSLYTVNGQLIQEYKTTEEGSLEISLNGQPQGIYLIKLNTTTIKVIKK